MMQRTRKSVPTEGVSRWWDVGWQYVMPDFDNKNHSIIEWYSDKAPVEPSNRVPEIQPESANARSQHRA